MGFLKKIFKPVAKVFDKIIPNEIKPALPYLAAFAPMMMPASFGIGSLGPMMSRGLMSGGLNIGAQLAQEGNEGDINALSALMAGGVGALSAPGAGDALRGYDGIGSDGIMGKGAGFLAKGADKLSGINAAGAANPFSMDGLKAAAIPFAQGTGDLMYAEGDRAMKDYEKALLDYENSLTEGQFATDAGRRAAIISAMTAGQHSQQVIDDTLAELGLRNGGIISLQNGGRVGLEFGGIPAAVEAVEQQPKEYLFDNKLKFTVNPGEDEKMSVLNALFGDEEGIISEDRKQEYYNLYIPQLYRNGKMSKTDYEGYIEEGILTEPKYRAKGGMINSYNNGGSVLPNGVEMDYRGGGFIPMGSKERADDVPARVSKNEFVMTADAVRAAGGGSVNKGARKMYELMNNLEARV